MTTHTEAPPRDALTAELELDATPESPLVASPSERLRTEVDDDHPLTREFFQAFCSSNHRTGRWQVPDEIEIRAIAGEVTLDFTCADLPSSGIVDVEALSICGEIKIVVPKGAEVEVEGTPILGGIEQVAHKKGTGEAIREWITGESEDDRAGPDSAVEPPFFHIEARAILGNIRVVTR